MSTKSETTDAIQHAKQDLDDALARLAKLPAVDADRLSYAAHALNNYLMVVSMISRIVQRDLPEQVHAEVRDRLEALNHATSLMKTAVKQLTLPTDEKPRLLFRSVDLARLLEAGRDQYEPLAAAKGITLLSDIPHGPVNVYTDRIALDAVLDNIMSNAVKYSVPGGVISVRLDQSNGEAICAISDSGPGIREQEASRLFTRGGRLSSRTTGGESSTGYGLAIAKDLIDALGGRIWYENGPDGGATFFVAIPLLSAETQSMS